MPAGEIADALHDAGQLRRLGLPIIPSTGTVADTAARVAAWVRGR
jgi:hypothetical protein